MLTIAGGLILGVFGLVCLLILLGWVFSIIGRLAGAWAVRHDEKVSRARGARFEAWKAACARSAENVEAAKWAAVR